MLCERKVLKPNSLSLTNANSHHDVELIDFLGLATNKILGDEGLKQKINLESKLKSLSQCHGYKIY